MIGETPNNVVVVNDEYLSKIAVLKQAGFFNMATGSFTAHFDAQGKIRKIEKHLTIAVM